MFKKEKTNENTWFSNNNKFITTYELLRKHFNQQTAKFERCPISRFEGKNLSQKIKCCKKKKKKF